MRLHVFLLGIIIPFVIAGTPSPSPPPVVANPARWFLIIDDRVDAPPLDISRAMPASQQGDGQPTSAKPTIIVVTAFAVPSSLQSCATIAIDLPLSRGFPGGIASQSSHPTTAHFWIWRNIPPSGRFTAAANLAIESWTATAPAHNATWSPNRELGVYRYVHSLTVPMTAGNTYFLGVFIEQPLYGSGNRVFWIANPPNHFGDQTHPFWFSDVYASWLPNPLNAVLQQNMTLAPNGTAFYSSPGDSVGVALRSVVTIISLNCTVVNPSQTIVPGIIWDYGRGTSLPPPSLVSIAPPTDTSLNTPLPPPPTPPPVAPTPIMPGATPPPFPTPPPLPPSIVSIPPVMATPLAISAFPPPPVGQTPTRVSLPPPPVTKVTPSPTTIIAAGSDSSSPTPPGVVQEPPAESSSFPAWAISTSILGGFLILALVVIGILIFLRRSRRFSFGLSTGAYTQVEDPTTVELEDSAEEMKPLKTEEEEVPKVPDKSQVVVLGDDENKGEEV